jgi:DNA-binding protein H-NS
MVMKTSQVRDGVDFHDPVSACVLDVPAEPEVDPSELRASALRQARRLVEFYCITPEELTDERDMCNSPESARGASESSVALTRAVKYRHPVTGETWDGVGPHPDWMRQALLKDGYRVAELLVEPPITAF